MLGQLLSSLDDPAVALGLVAALDDPVLRRSLTAAAESAETPAAELIAASVRRFIDTASDDQWTQLIGIMSRAEDPGLAALHAILRTSFPPVLEPVR